MEITPAWLRARSPVRGLLRFTPAEFLRWLYYPRECIVILTNPRSQGRLWRIPRRVRGPELDEYRDGHRGVWFLSQPVDGYTYFNPRTGYDSQRSQESVIAWRYAVLESDKVPAELWLKILVQLPLPIAAIYSSGGDSVHALILVDACRKKDWDAIMCHNQLEEILAAYGVDPRTITAVRLTRLPQCVRGQTGKLQELFFLNPEPTFEPLWTRALQ